MNLIHAGGSALFLLFAVGDDETIGLLDRLWRPADVRAIGPAAPGGRIVDVAVDPARPFELWAASASGGLWKSVNNGTTWSCAFDGALSIGDVAIAPSDPDVVWIGTGEGNNQRSSYAGNGVWRSTDRGVTWSHLGLEETHHVGRVVVDPRDADVAWVAALGHLYSANDERGLYKTSDGGVTWERVLFLGDETGIADVTLDPTAPDTVYAASYRRLRRAWNFDDVGDSAIYKSVDGGASWKRLAGGLPGGKLGRIGIELFPADPQRLYACIDNENPGEPDKEGKPRPIGGEIWCSLDGGRSWEKRNEKPVRGEPPYYYGQIRVDPHDPERVWLLGIVLFVSEDGGRTFSEGKVASSLHSDHHALWFDPDRRDRLLLGNDGGLAQSYDGGATWDSYGNLPIAQFYTVSVDERRPYRVYGGLQDNGIWSGPSRSRFPGGAVRSEWRFIGGGDGMYVLADPDDPDTVYLEAQFGSLQRVDVRSAESKWIQPVAREEKSPDARAKEAPRERFNWCSPLVVSSHNSRVLWFGSQRLWKSVDRGDHWKPASGDLTTNDAEKVKGNVPHCTLTTISESPLDPDLLLVGSDDGKVQWTANGGRDWSDLSDRFPDLPPDLWVSRVELSHHDVGSAWVAFSGYREDDFEPWVYRTRDGGETFTRVVAGLPTGPVNVVRESPRKANVLFLGSDAGAFVSLDGGDRWRPLAAGLPMVSVLDLVVHPREPDVVLGTHGRGFFVVDVTPHEQVDDKVVAADAWLFAPGESVAWKSIGWDGAGDFGERHWRGSNPASGASLWYWLGAQGGKPTLEIVDASGKVVRSLEAAEGEGLHRVVWDLRFDPKKEEAKPLEEPEEKVRKEGEKKRSRRLYEPGSEEEADDPADEIEAREREEAEEEEAEEEEDESRTMTQEMLEEELRELLPFAQDAGGGRGRRRGAGGGDSAPPGAYRIRLRLGEKTLEQPLTLRPDPLTARD